MTINSVPAPAGAVVVGVDGSGLSESALLWAAAEAARLGSPLHIVHAFVYVHAMGGFAVVDVATPDEIGGEVCAAALERVRAEFPDLAVTTEVRVGPAAPQLIKASRQASMVVLGARGHGRIGGVLVGSVSQQVALHSRCPVVVVRGGVEGGPVVVGLDGSVQADEALRFALRHAEGVGAPLRVVRAEYVEAPPGVPPGEWYADLVDRMQALTESVRSKVEEVAREHPGVEVELEILHQHPVSALVDESAQARLIVVASRGLGGFAGLLLGSVSQGVLSRSMASVAVVPPAGGPREEPEARDITR
ncbi:universal stress protein [Georgenia sp. 311]|uniref:universal stress protein n=1 Tax=Georgenia sp. 311 TaxID=2585134 RepID=UPI001111D8B1|nr:universal stress protein [Georgenia sp. 311]TNC17267.1 universal stress protein [Georgenia sp. 311]